MCVYVSVCVCVYLCYKHVLCHRTPLESGSSPSIVWVPRLELRGQSWQPAPLSAQHLASPLYSIFPDFFLNCSLSCVGHVVLEALRKTSDSVTNFGFLAEEYLCG